MAKATKRATKQERTQEESSQHDRAPYQNDSDRDPVKSSAETRHIPTQGHGAIK
jgi:hypothetical protein